MYFDYLASKPISVEQGLVRSIAADAAGDENNALYDKTGPVLLAPVCCSTRPYVACRMSHAVMRGSSDAVIRVLRRL